VLIGALWVVAGALIVASLFSARLIVRPGRARIWSTPKEVGLEYEDITFKAQDGVNLVGWFIPAPAQVPRPAPLIILVHGWPWCRMGTQANSLFNDLPGSKPVNLLPFMKRLHDEGYHVIAADHRNFGDSESRGVVTSGWLEGRDVVGEVDYLRGRPDVDVDRIGAIGFSQGGSTVMFASPITDRIKAAIAIQPTRGSVFGPRYAHALMGPLAYITLPLSELFYRIAGGPAISSIDVACAAAGARCPFLYIQGTGDPWGTVDDVKRMAAMTPGSTAIYPETKHRFEGYLWVLANPDVSVDFMRKHLSADASKTVKAPASLSGPQVASRTSDTASL
jgi:dipeptidyl aminopeptidase/acylaminoacyl peptidase